MDEMKSCLVWCREFLNAALNTNQTPDDLIAEYDYTFPKFQPYEYETEQMYQLTNFDKNSKKVIEERLRILREHIDIDTESSVRIFDTYNKLLEEGKIE